MESKSPDETPQRAEDSLADLIAGNWHELDKKSAAENSDELRKNEQFIIAWAEKLTALIAGRIK